MTVWGKAGQRLTDEEAAARRRKYVAARNNAEASRVAAEQEGRRLWRAGRLIPWRITVALDRNNLYGPEVDIACGTQEPDVDHWEAGIVYPTWEQTRLLAELCGVTVPFLCHDGLVPVNPLCSKWGRYDDEPPPVMRFLPEAVDRTLRAEGVIQ